MADSNLYNNIANDYSDGNANDIQHVSQQGGKVRVISGILTVAGTDLQDGDVQQVATADSLQ